jgi:hypothetical protein
VFPSLENQGDQNLLERICDSLEPKDYNEGIYIFREGEPLMMLFITQGSVCCFKTSTGTDSDAEYIEKGQFWGKELLEWGFNRSSSHKKSAPISTKTVKTHSKVEAFSLTANDLKNLLPIHTRATDLATKVASDLATKVFPKGVFRRKENKNENFLEMSEQNGTSILLTDDVSKSC